MLTIAADHVFVEIPPRCGPRLGAELFEQWAGIFARHAGFGKHGEFHAKGVFTEVSNLFVAAGFLRKVVGWKAKGNADLFTEQANLVTVKETC
jgi:hypothetical protein